MKLNIETSDSQGTLHILEELFSADNVSLVYDDGRIAEYIIASPDGQERVYRLESLQELTHWFFAWQIRIY